MTHLVRATQEPGVVREIDDAELLDLARQGLLYSYEHTDEAAAVLKGTKAKTSGKWKAANRGDNIVTAPAATTDPDADDELDDPDADAELGSEKGE